MEKMFNMNDTQAKTQMENFWKYLDDLATEKPEEYKKFISEQMKKGFDNKIEDKKEETKQIILKPKLFICLRFKISKILKEKCSDKENDIKIYDTSKNTNYDILAIPKILFSFEWQSEAFSTKILEEPKVYLNIIHSEEFIGPLDDYNKPLKNPENDKEWKYIPTEVRYNNKKSCMSGKRCDFYDMMVNSKVIETIIKSEELKRSLLAYFVRKFTIFLNNKYELYINNVKILKSKKYKSIKNVPEDFIYKPNAKYGTALENSDENKKKEIVSNNNSNLSNYNPPAQNFFDVPGNKINIPCASENFTNTPNFYNNINSNNSKLNNKKNLQSNKNKEDDNINKNKKKILIEDITKKTKRAIEVKKKILSDNQMEVMFILEIFEEVESINDIDLQVSENGIKLYLEKVPEDEYEPIDMNFNFSVDPDKCIAKYDKMNRILKLILFKV